MELLSILVLEISEAVDRFLRNKYAKTVFKKKWVPALLNLFAEQKSPTQFLLHGDQLSLEVGGEWAYCQYCRTTQRPFPERKTCVQLRSECSGTD